MVKVDFWVSMACCCALTSSTKNKLAAARKMDRLIAYLSTGISV
jgi:hypothetical protein